MANHCGFCDTRRPVDGTSIMVLGGDWIEFCPLCGELETLTNAETGEVCTVNEVCRRIGGNPPLPNPERVAHALEMRKKMKDYEKEQKEYYAKMAAKREEKRIKRRGPLRGGIGSEVCF